MNETLRTAGQVLHVQPLGAAPVTLIVQPLAGLSPEMAAALLPYSAVVTWHSRSPLGHEAQGVAFLRAGEELEMAIFMSGLSQMQAHAAAEALAGAGVGT